MMDACMATSDALFDTRWLDALSCAPLHGLCAVRACKGGLTNATHLDRSRAPGAACKDLHAAGATVSLGTVGGIHEFGGSLFVMKTRNQSQGSRDQVAGVGVTLIRLPWCRVPLPYIPIGPLWRQCAVCENLNHQLLLKTRVLSVGSSPPRCETMTTEPLIGGTNDPLSQT